MKIHSLSAAALLFLGALSRAEDLPISSLDLGLMQQDYRKPGINVSVEQKPLTIGAQTFTSGVGTHANSTLWIDLKKSASRFTAMVGVDAEKNPSNASVEFIIKGDGKVLWRSGLMKAADAAKKADVDLRGIGILALRVTDGGDDIESDHADWADAQITFSGTPPVAIPVPIRPALIATPKPAPQPKIHTPVVFGVRPGSPFLFTIAATGTRPMTFAADLPTGLTLDPATGHITGSLREKGEFPVTLIAKNALGEARKAFRILCGDEIALTPPMGWNSWNCWGDRVDAEKVLRSARALVAAGLDQHGFSYINIDDAWQGERGGPHHAIQPDPTRFPNMRGLCDEVHALGLKVGIYSTPWTVSYARRLGGSSRNPEGKWDPAADLKAGINNHTYPFEVGPHHFAQNDAKQWAEWGIDYLKYDWGPVDVANTREMAEALRASGRDVVFSLSNNGAGNILGILPELSPLANAWRTTNDINDTWKVVASIGFNQNDWAAGQRPGHYNDPDMLVVGQVGWGKPHPTRLTPDEQVSHMSLWCLLGAPLLLGCDLEKLDDFTLALLTNDEVIEINQDPLCRQAVRVASAGNLDVFAKPLADGSLAVGLFNRSSDDATIVADWKDLKLNGKQRVRDLWQLKDLGLFEQKFTAPVAPHGVVLLRLFPVQE